MQVIGVRAGNFAGQPQEEADLVVDTLLDVTDTLLASPLRLDLDRIQMLEQFPKHVTIYEVGPRDGLQNEARPIATGDKIAMIDALTATGLPRIEITSFVNPKWIPQLADATDVARGIKRKEGVVYSCLVPNKKGLEKALDAGMKEVAVFLSASETHNKKNVNKTIAETLAAFEEVIGPATEAGVRVRAYVSTVYGCPYEGAVDPKKVVALVEELRRRGVYQNLARRHHRRGHAAAGRSRARGRLERGAARRRSPCTSTTRAARRWPTCSSPSAWAWRRSTPPSVGSAAVPMRPAPAATWRRRTSSTCCTAWASRPGSISTRSSPAPRKLAAVVGHEMPSKYTKAALGARAKAATRSTSAA